MCQNKDSLEFFKFRHTLQLTSLLEILDTLSKTWQFGQFGNFWTRFTFFCHITNLENRLWLQQPESLLFSGSKIRWWPEFQKETISVSQVIQFSNLEVRWKVSINQCMYLLISFPCNIQLKGDHLVRLPQRLSLGQRMVILAKMLVPTSQLLNYTIIYISTSQEQRNMSLPLFGLSAPPPVWCWRWDWFSQGSFLLSPWRWRKYWLGLPLDQR